MRKILLIQILLLIVVLFIKSPSFAKQREGSDVKEAIVQIHKVSSKPYYYSPWKLSNSESSTGSGCVIRGERILTNAHVVSNQKFLQVQKYGDPKRYNASVLHVSHEADIALLTVEDKSFFSHIEPLDFGTLPETLQEVLVYGFPTGGDALSITKGIFSRIVYQEYVHSNNYHIAGQIDAAVNPGNSGGPVIVDNKIVGVVMQTLKNTENIGYMIPNPAIEHFLKDIEDGSFNDSPELGFVTQKMESPGMKRKYGMGDKQTGVLVIHVYWNSSAQGIIKEGDAILSIDGHQIADDGTVEIRPKERIKFTYYSDMHQIGEKLNLKVLRNGKIENVTYTLTQTRKDILLVASMQYDQKPRYFIFGGIVFTPLTENLICVWEDCDAPDNLLTEKEKRPTNNRQEVVVAIHVLAAEVNKGYHDISVWVAREINGKEFKDFNEFYELINKSTEPFIVFKNDKGHQIVIDRKKAYETHQDVLKTYNITEDRSSGLR